MERKTHRHNVVRGAVHHLEQLEDEAGQVVSLCALGSWARSGGSFGGSSTAHGSLSGFVVLQFVRFWNVREMLENDTAEKRGKSSP